MKPRVVATAVLGSLLATLPAAADRRSKRRVADVEEDVDEDGPEARSALTVKLDDLIEVAVRLSPELARSKNDRLTAKGQAVAARGPQQWVVSAGSTVERFSLGPDVEVGAFQVVAENKLAANLGIGRNLPTGGNFQFEIGIQRTLKEFELPAGLGKLMGDRLQDSLEEAARQKATTPAELQDGDRISDTSIINQATAKVTLQQPLLRSFGSDVALAEEKKADFAATDATVKTQYAAEEMVHDVVAGYWELAYASHEVDKRAEALALARKQEDLTRTEMRAGTKPMSELNSVLYEISIREEALLAAKNELEKKSLDLRRKVGLELDRRDIVMRPMDPFEIDAAEWDIEEVIARSRRGNRRLASIILQKRSADVDVKVANNGMLPKVDLAVSGAVFGSGGNPDEAFSGSAGAAGFQVTGSLTVQFEIGGAAKGAHDAARARRQRLEIDQAELQRTIDTEIVHAVHAVKSAQARVALSENAILVSEANERAERASFQANRSDNYRVMSRQTELVTARLRRGRAITEYHLAVAKLQLLGGMLLEQYRINVRPLPRTK
jgi:outer membrane protein TolC